MNWFYESNGRQAGPVSDAQLDDLLRAGSITAGTLVWRDGMRDWQPFSAARPTADATPQAPPRLVVDLSQNAICAECGHQFPQSDMLFLNQSWVCAHCKPRFLQRMLEGGTPRITSGLIWRSNRQFVMSHNTPLPDRCVCCNEPSRGYKLKRSLSWHPPAYYLLIIPSVLIYVIVAMIVRKTSTLHVGLCERHRAARKWNIIGSWLGVVASLGLFVVSANYDSGWVFLAGLILLLGAIIYGLVKAQIVSAARIDGDFVWVKGAGQSFLATLPDWMGPR